MKGRPEALVLAVYQLKVDQLTGSVPGLLAALPPLVALRRWTTDLVGAMRRKHGLGEASAPAPTGRSPKTPSAATSAASAS